MQTKFLHRDQIPQPVRKEANELIEMYGERIQRLGHFQGAEAFCYCFPEGVRTGFPVVYLLEADKVNEVTGFDALDITSLFFED